MLLVRLYQYDHAKDAMGQDALLRFDDGDLQRVLGMLEDTDAGTLSLRIKSADSNAEIGLQWRADLAGFVCSVEGRAAGYISYDELKGALGVPVPVNNSTCRVCLQAEMDIWRYGLIDLDRGYTHVYTKTPGLATLGAYAFVTDPTCSPGLVGLQVAMKSGEPTNGPLRIPGVSLRFLQGAASIGKEVVDQNIDAAFEHLSELSSTVADFQKTLRGSIG